jgi:uncharacterized membrane protein YfcA
MFFPISGAHISPIYLVIVGFVIGILGGFFGVGGSFIAGPALRAVGLDWNFAIGTDLAHIVGKSVVAVREHRAFGNVDLKLGLIMAVGTIGGAEVGAQLIQILKRAGNVNLVVSVVSIVVYVSISTFMIWESRKTLRSKKGAAAVPPTASSKKHDPSSFAHVTRSIQRWNIPPLIRLPVSGVTISLWVILLVAFVGGLFSGFLGGGAGYIRMSAPICLRSLSQPATEPSAMRSKATSTFSSRSLCTPGPPLARRSARFLRSISPVRKSGSRSCHCR